MVIQEQRYTFSEFWQFALLPANVDKRLELLRGVLYEVSPSQAIPTVIAARINRLLGNFVEGHDLGYVTGADGGFKLSEQDFFAPDVAYISRARLPQLPNGFFPIAPDFAVEVVSPHDAIKQVHKKAMRYLVLGTRMVWVVYPDDRTVDVYRPTDDGAHVQEFDEAAILDGGDVLPGFTLSVRDIFPKS